MGRAKAVDECICTGLLLLLIIMLISIVHGQPAAGGRSGISGTPGPAQSPQRPSAAPFTATVVNPSASTPTQASTPPNFINPVTQAPAASAAPAAATPVAAATPAAATPTPPASAEPVAGAQAQPASGENITTLAPFVSVVSCVPFAILVSPAAAGYSYSASIIADSDLQRAISFAVENKTLYVGFNQSYTSRAPIKVNISVAANQLDAVTASGMGNVIINPGFATQSTKLSASGTGKILARGLNTASLVVKTTGVSDVFAKGQIAAAQVTAQGTGRITLSGVTTSVTADVSGISTLFVDSAAESTKIAVTPRGISKVYYTRGQCTSNSGVSMDVPFFSMDLGLSGCVQADAASFPRYKAMWTCGQRAKGSALCAPGALAAAASGSQVGDVSVSSDGGYASATSSPGGAASASSSSYSPPPPEEVAPEAQPAQPPAPGPAASAGARPTASARDADVSVAQSGRRRVMQAQRAHHRAFDRRLANIWSFPNIDLQFPMDFDDGADRGNGRSSYASSSSDGGDNNSGNSNSAVAVTSLTCNVPVEEQYIAAK